jgi:uncharacterized membrane protein YecN with MAPEG domain
MMSTYALPSFVTTIALMVYFIVTLNVGRARAKYQIKPPITSGNPDFERVLRVQQNMVEQLVVFLPALWLFSVYIDPRWGAGIGTLWVLGRILYAWGYYQAVEKRWAGFVMSVFSTSLLVFGSLVGVLIVLLHPSP